MSYFDFLQEQPATVNPSVNPKKPSAIDDPSFGMLVTDPAQMLGNGMTQTLALKPMADRHLKFQQERVAAKDALFSAAEKTIREHVFPGREGTGELNDFGNSLTSNELVSKLNEMPPERWDDYISSLSGATDKTPHWMDEFKAANAIYKSINQRPEAKEIDANIKDIDRQVLEQKQKAQGLPVAPPPLKNQNTPEEVMKANGVPQEDYYKGILELAKKLGVDNVDQPVNFGVGLNRVLGLPEMADVKKEFENEAQNLSDYKYAKPSTMGTPVAGISQANAEREQRKLDYKKLGELDEMHSWASVLGYVLLSMVIGPHLSALFFRWNSQDKNQLKLQIQDRNEKIKLLQHNEEKKTELAMQEREFYRKLAAESMMHRQEKTFDLNARFKEQLFIHAMDAFNRASLHSKANENKEMEKFIGAQRANFSRAMSLANLADKKAKDMMDNGSTEEAKRLKEEAGLRYQEAQKIDEYVTELNKQLYGHSESDAESEPANAAAGK